MKIQEKNEGEKVEKRENVEKAKSDLGGKKLRRENWVSLYSYIPLPIDEMIFRKLVYMKTISVDLENAFDVKSLSSNLDNKT